MCGVAGAKVVTEDERDEGKSDEGGGDDEGRVV